MIYYQLGTALRADRRDSRSRAGVQRRRSACQHNAASAIASGWHNILGSLMRTTTAVVHREC